MDALAVLATCPLKFCDALCAVAPEAASEIEVAKLAAPENVAAPEAELETAA